MGEISFLMALDKMRASKHLKLLRDGWLGNTESSWKSSNAELPPKKQLITREQSSEDKRANIVSITAKGREIFQKSMAVLGEIYGPIANSISQKERDTVNTILDKLLESLNTLR